MKSILVCWQEVPDETHFVVLSGIPEDIFEVVVGFNGQYINGTGEHSRIWNFFYDAEGVFRFQKLEGPVRNWPFDAVIHTGIIL